MSYNLSFMDNVTSPLTMAAGVNDASEGVLFIAILFFFWIVLFIAFGNFNLKDRFLGSTFLTTIGGVLLLGAGLLEFWAVMIPTVFTLIALVYKLWR